jgi:hypothetical protein
VGTKRVDVAVCSRKDLRRDLGRTDDQSGKGVQHFRNNLSTALIFINHSLHVVTAISSNDYHQLFPSLTGLPGGSFQAPSGTMDPLRIPNAKKRTALLGTLRVVFRRFRSQPVGRLIEEINPILRGWVNYFAMGHSSRCFAFIRDWVEKKIRSHLARACQRRGFGWKRWSREWLYGTLGLFNQYHVSYRPSPTAVPIS